MLERIIAREALYRARGLRVFPGQSVGDDIEIYTDETRPTSLVFHTLRQQIQKEPDKPNEALSDYVAPRRPRSRLLRRLCRRHPRGRRVCRRFDAAHDPYSAIMVKALADRFAEAFAELLHHRARVAWGYERPNEFNAAKLITEKYRGIRPAPGYPSQPDHTEKETLFALLDARSTGVTLTESMAMHPGSAVSGLYFSPPRQPLLHDLRPPKRPDQILRRAQRHECRGDREVARAVAGVLSKRLNQVY